jgi:hypothetical protein
MYRTINPQEDRSITPLTLIRGNADWVNNNLIDIFDAVVVGTQFDMLGNLDGDVNFDGRVTIGDLTIIGGHFHTTSEDYYGTCQP